MDPVLSLEQTLGTSLGVVHLYQAWGDGAHSEFHPEWLAAAATGGRRVLLTWEPWSSSGSAKQPRYRLRRIVSGAFDGYVRQWAQVLAAYGAPVYLRPMHEMNANWYPWSGVTNGNTPEEYVQAWRHLHDILAQEGATNVRWVWSPYSMDVPATNTLERYYPGDGYVDLLAMDGYNWGTCRPDFGGWRSFDQIFRPAYRRLVALADKPVWIAEMASAPDGGDKSAWVAAMVRSLLNHYPAIDAVVWFNVNKECDWRLTSPPGVILALHPLLQQG